MVTSWQGDREDPAHLKIDEDDGRPAKREDRQLRPGIVDFVLLWDLIALWRPQQLVSAGTVDTMAAYDLVDDLRSGKFALFPTARRSVKRAHKSRTDVSPMIGRELHHIVRTYLRPMLPIWEDLDGRWRSLWAAHILRLLNASYWAGVRQDMEYAKLLLMDTEATIRREYVTLNPYINERLGLDTTNWEHPRAYDAYMDALCRQFKRIDPTKDPLLPRPDVGNVTATTTRRTPRFRRSRAASA
jgi:hypothetical protein